MRIVSVVLLASALVLFPGCKEKSKAKREEDAFKELASSKGDLDRALREGMTDEGLTIDHDVLAARQASIAEAARKMGGKQGQALGIFAEIHADSNEVAKVIEKKSTEMAAAFDWQTLAKEGDYVARRKMLNEYAEFNRETVRSFEARPAEISKRLDEIDFKGRERDDLEKGFNSTYQPMLRKIKKIRGCDITVCEIGIRTLDLLEKEHGDWQWGPEGLTFDNSKTESAFQKEMTSLQETAQEQLRLQRELVESATR